MSAPASTRSFTDLPDDVLEVLGAILPAQDAQTVAACSTVARAWRRRVPEAWACAERQQQRRRRAGDHHHHRRPSTPTAAAARGGGGAADADGARDRGQIRGNEGDDDDGDSEDDDDDAAAAFAFASDDGGEQGQQQQRGRERGGGFFRRHAPLADLDAAAPDFEDRCAALACLMPRGLSSVRVTLPGARAVAAGAPSAPRVLATLLLALRGGSRPGSGGGGAGGGGGVQHLTLHLDEDGVELFDDGGVEGVVEEEQEQQGEDGAGDRHQQQAGAGAPPPAPPAPPAPPPLLSGRGEGGGGASPPPATDPPPLPPHLGALRSLAVTGGALSRRSTARLLRALAAACPRLEALRLLPDRAVAAPGAGGLSDADVPLLAALAASAPLLATLEFSAAGARAMSGGGGGEEEEDDGGPAPPGAPAANALRLGFTGAGLVALARALPSLRVLRVHRLDALAAVAAADAQCFACRPALRELHLGCDAALPPEAARRLAAAAGGLSMRFRWSEPPLLKTATIGLAGTLLRLDLGVVRLPGGGGAARRFARCLSGLTRLQNLRCALTAGPMGEGEGGGGEEEEQEEEWGEGEERGGGGGGSSSSGSGSSGDENDGGGRQHRSDPLHCSSRSHHRRHRLRAATFNLSQLASLTDLRALEITKRAAWSVPAPAQQQAYHSAGGGGRGAFVEPSLSIPLSPGGAAALAHSCGRLRALRLRLSRRDVSAEGLAALSRFSRLERLSLVVDHNSNNGNGNGGDGGGSGGGISRSLSSSPAAGGGGSLRGGLLSSSLPGGGSLGGGGSSSFLHATALVPLDLLDLPAMLTALHLRHVSICTAPAALEALLSSGGGDGGRPSSSSSPGNDGGAPCPPPARAAGPSSSPSPPPPLSCLADLDLEQCRLRPAQLAALARATGRSLRRLRLSGVAGLSDEALPCLGAATALRELSVEAPGNRLVTQRGLLALATGSPPPLRRLSWRSDDLSRLGPVLGAYAAFTALRGLSLSCTRAAAERGARLRRAHDAAAAAADPAAAAAAELAAAGGPVDALRALLPLATIGLAGSAPLAPLLRGPDGFGGGGGGSDDE